jgi:hypothetical protein
VLSTILVLFSISSRVLRAGNLLLDVPAKERQVEDKRHPVSIDKEEECQETVYGSLWDDVGVESVAEVNRVNVVTVIGRSVFIPYGISDTRIWGAKFDHRSGTEKGCCQHTIPSHCT